MAKELEANETVTLKPGAVEVKKDEPNKPSLPPYHTEETAKIAEDRAKENEADKDKPYEFKANGYTVTEDKNEHKDLPSTYTVTSGDFVKTFPEKRDAEVYAMTHAEAHKDQPAEVSK